MKPKDQVEYDIYKTLVKLILLKNEFNKIIIDDITLSEGIFHLLPIFKNMKNLKERDFLFINSTLNNQRIRYFVFIEINSSIAYDRVLKEHNNHNPRFSDNDLLKLKKRYEIMDENQELIKDMLRNKNIIILDGSKSISENSFVLSKIIFNLIK